MSKKLSKSRFKIALERPTKLYYNSNFEYGNKKLDGAFLKALAKEGFQVGELAKAYYPDGQMINTLNKVDAIAQTKKLMQKESIVIFEPTCETDDFFIRVDILVKNKNPIRSSRFISKYTSLRRSPLLSLLY